MHYVSSNVQLVTGARQLSSAVDFADAVDSLDDLRVDPFDAAVYAPAPAETKSRVFEWIDGVHANLRVGGVFYVGGERHRGVESYKQRMEAVFGRVEKLRQIGRRRVYVTQKTDHPGVPPVETTQLVDISIEAETLAFVTRAGVFSKDHLDPGSRLLLETTCVGRNQAVLDIGCGYGPLGIFLARRGASVTMSDVDVRATRCAEENVDRAGVSVEVHTADLYDGVAGRSFDSIVTNPPFHAGHAFAHPLVVGARSHLRSGGRLWLVVMRADPYRKLLEQNFAHVETTCTEGGYSVLVASNRGNRRGA